MHDLGCVYVGVFVYVWQYSRSEANSYHHVPCAVAAMRYHHNTGTFRALPNIPLPALKTLLSQPLCNITTSPHLIPGKKKKKKKSP